MIDEQLIQFYLTVSAARRRRFFVFLRLIIYIFLCFFLMGLKGILSHKSPECLSNTGTTFRCSTSLTCLRKPVDHKTGGTPRFFQQTGGTSSTSSTGFRWVTFTLLLGLAKMIICVFSPFKSRSKTMASFLSVLEAKVSQRKSGFVSVQV